MAWYDDLEKGAEELDKFGKGCTSVVWNLGCVVMIVFIMSVFIKSCGG